MIFQTKSYQANQNIIEYELRCESDPFVLFDSLHTDGSGIDKIIDNM